MLVAALDGNERAFEFARSTALAACDELARDFPREQIDALRRLRKQVKSGRVAADTDVPPSLAEQVGQLAPAAAAVDAARARLLAFLAADQDRVAEVLSSAVRNDQFREALAWQSQTALHGSIDALAQPSADRKPSRVRQGQQLVASYLQRYFVKNDSIGFFGPIAWGSFDTHAQGITVRPGDALLSRRTTYFEYWPIEALARTLGADAALRPWWTPCRVPTVRVEGTTLYLSPERSSTISELQGRVFGMCDGRRTAHDIAHELAAAGAVPDPAAGLAELETLERSGAIDWALDVPTELAHPEVRLRATLDRIGDAAARATHVATLDELVSARDAVARSGGSSAAVDGAMGELAATFERVTGVPATRRGGKTYAARQLVYEDCVRDVDVAIAPSLLQNIAPALGLVLASARWFCHEIAAGYRALFASTYRTLREQTQTSAVDASRFVRAISAGFAGNQYDAPPVVQATKDELQRRWARLLGTSGAGEPIVRSADELAARAAEEFAAPGPGWPLARYQSPDLMFAAASVDALAAGDFTAVLGEVHPGLNAGLNIPPLALQSPNLDELLAWRSIDVPGPCIHPVIARAAMDRAAVRSLVPGDLHVEVGTGRSWRPRDQVLAIADLVVEELGGRLQVRTRGGERAFDAIAFFEYYLIVASAGHFSIVPGAAHSPRVTIDRLVIARERWKLSLEELPFVAGDARVDRVADALRWARGRGIPRFVFAKTSNEPKPFYVDFASAPLVENLTRAVRQSGAVSLSEMLPSHGEHWLSDAAGARYACELRMVAVDPVPWGSGGSGGSR